MGADLSVPGKVALFRNLSTIGIAGKNLVIYYDSVLRVVTDLYIPVMLENLHFQTSLIPASLPQ